MKLAALICLLVFLAADGESIPVEQDSRKQDLLTQCLVQILSKALHKNETPLQAECKNILAQGSGYSTIVKDSLEPTEEKLKKPREESKVEEKLIEDVLKGDRQEEPGDERSQEEFPSFAKKRTKDRREELDDERSQEEFPSFMKRRIKEKRDEMDDERSQEEFPSFVKRRSKNRREEMDDERSQEEFPSFMKRRMKGKREEMDDERSQEEFPSFMKRRMKGKREDLNDERSQEEFPSFMKRRMKGKREEMDDERSQEEFPSFMKRRTKGKREEMDDERSQEEFPSYYKRGSKYKREDPDDERSQEEFPQKRHLFGYYKRDNPDEERSQEEFPFYEYKRSRFLTGREKRDELDYDRSQEDFPSYIYKRNYRDGDEEDEESEEREKRIWKPSHRYHHKKKHHKRDENEDVEEPDYDRSQEDFPSFTKRRSHGIGGHYKHNEGLVNEQYEEINSRPHYKNPKQDSSEDDSAETIREMNEKRHPSASQKNEGELMKAHKSSAEEMDREAALRYLTKKKNELEERLSKGEKRSPWIYRGYYHPAWYKRSQKVDESTDQHPYQKLEELAESLRAKRGLPSKEEDEDVPQKEPFTPEELKELEKLASVDQQIKDTT